MVGLYLPWKLNLFGCGKQAYVTGCVRFILAVTLTVI